MAIKWRTSGEVFKEGATHRGEKENSGRDSKRRKKQILGGDVLMIKTFSEKNRVRVNAIRRIDRLRDGEKRRVEKAGTDKRSMIFSPREWKGLAAGKT